MDEQARRQLGALSGLHEEFERDGIDYRLFGGWAVDFHVGSVTRPHDDLDLAVWFEDLPRIEERLAAGGWRHAPLKDEDGGTGYERGGVRLELTYLVRDGEGAVCIPLRAGLARWSDGPLGGVLMERFGVRARVVDLAVLRRDKSRGRSEPEDAAKDSADFDALLRIS